ncbi:Exocyst complex component 3 [Armadillidium nasatum]|uniref:Exocyst complex component 3 n=1 Tax=Armadillidium nasatum TaxID=96803 RepID=A0A5N5T813_9CRUS|nr:Exocyst complex component 3 [Armadillidium nasatum]
MYKGETADDARNRATLLVENMLQRPDQLQKVEQYKRRVQRKNLSVEAMLKTAMQSQLDGVRTGLSQLQSALIDLQEIKSGLTDIEESLVKVPELNKVLQTCREEYLRHSQYAAAMDNLKHIFTVPDSIEKTKQYIADGKLLNAHQCIMDLENSRDDLLFELHKLPHQNPNESRLLKEYFADMQTLSEDLGKQLWIILQRTLNTVRKEPTQIVTALRIIEREERADQYALSRQKASNFLPPGRPKQWRKKAFEVFEKVVSQRIEGNQFEDRESNKNWLIRHLEVIRLMLLEDFKVIKSQCVPCFPPSYGILNTYIDMYHRNLSAHNVKLNYESWMARALELEEKEWVRPEPPQQDGDAHYKTELPHLLHDMMRQNLDVAATISSEVQAHVLIT